MELLIIIKIANVTSSNKASLEVNPNINNRIATMILAIGIKIPNPITGKIFLVVNKETVFSKNLGVRHKHNSQITMTVTRKVLLC